MANAAGAIAELNDATTIIDTSDFGNLFSGFNMIYLFATDFP